MSRRQDVYRWIDPWEEMERQRYQFDRWAEEERRECEAAIARNYQAMRDVNLQDRAKLLDLYAKLSPELVKPLTSEQVMMMRSL